MVAPRTLRPTVPLELSTVAYRALGHPDSTGSGGVRTGAAVLRVLEQHASFDSATSPRLTNRDTADNEVWRREDPAPDHAKRKKLMISMIVLAAATLLVVGSIILTVINVFTGTGSGGPSKIIGPDTGLPSSNSPAPSTAAPRQIAIASATAYSPQGTVDSPEKVNNLFDGNPTTAWGTASYLQQFGPHGLQAGTGVVLNLASPTVARSLIIDSPSAGTHIEIRAAGSDHPDLASSPVIGAGDITGERTTIPINSTQPTQHLIIWITQLAPKDGQFQSQLNEVTVMGTPS